jgi:polyisoprenoid-binding protein YceI
MQRSTRNRIGLGALVVVIVLGAAAWWLGLFASEPAEVSLEQTASQVTADATVAEGPTSDGIDDLTGTWNVVPGDATFVGYRVNEVLSSIGDFTAVGRTGAVTGTLEAQSTTISAVDITADLTTLTSDSSARDRQMRGQALETDTFPTAGFVLAEPIELEAIPAPGETVSETAIGDLTLHGVTNRVEVPIEGTIVGETLVVVGSIEISMADYDITPPRAPVVARVDDRGVMELSLVLTRS